MTLRRAEFNRMVLGLPQSRKDYAAVSAAAKLAELLGLDLLATCIEDANLIAVAGLPFVRELRPLGGGWRPIEAAKMKQELDRAAETTRRLFAETVQTQDIAVRFAHERGSAPAVIASLAQADDIVVIIEPSNPAERVTQQFMGLVDAAFKTAAAVMIVPSHIARMTGPIVAVAVAPGDPSIFCALDIASATKEKLVVITPYNFETSVELNERAKAAGVSIELLVSKAERIDLSAISRNHGDISERLIVMTRDGVDRADPSRIASLRGIPVLVVEPADDPV